MSSSVALSLQSLHRLYINPHDSSVPASPLLGSQAQATMPGFPYMVARNLNEVLKLLDQAVYQQPPP